MVENETVIGPEAGLHAHPAVRPVKKARGFGPDTKVAKDGRGAGAKSTMKTMTLGAKKDDGIIIRAGGEDAEAAVTALVGLISAEEG